MRYRTEETVSERRERSKQTGGCGKILGYPSLLLLLGMGAVRLLLDMGFSTSATFIWIVAIPVVSHILIAIVARIFTRVERKYVFGRVLKLAMGYGFLATVVLYLGLLGYVYVFLYKR